MHCLNTTRCGADFCAGTFDARFVLMQTDVPECLHCGACCFSQLTNYVRVTGSDHARLGERAEHLVTFDGTRAYMRMVDGHCAALAVHPDGHWACTTYETRPQTCRDLTRASAECAGEIAEKAERPLIALGRFKSTL